MVVVVVAAFHQLKPSHGFGPGVGVRVLGGSVGRGLAIQVPSGVLLDHGSW